MYRNKKSLIHLVIKHKTPISLFGTQNKNNVESITFNMKGWYLLIETNARNVVEENILLMKKTER